MVLNLSCEQIKSFIDGHNYRRQQLLGGEIDGQPAASKMKLMVWYNELAAKAEDWASKYRIEHNPDGSTRSGRFPVGENIFWKTSSNLNYEMDIDLALTEWFEEHRDFTYGPIKESDFYGPVDIGHYTQMAWSNTTYLGCAISKWSAGRRNKFMVVCNYGPTGNYPGQAPYPKGNPGGRLTCNAGNCKRRYGDRC